MSSPWTNRSSATNSSSLHPQRPQHRSASTFPMGTEVHVLPNVNDLVPVRSRRPHSRRVLLFMWLWIVAVPWVLQLHSFSKLVRRHRIAPHFIPSPAATVTKTAKEVAARCPIHGMRLAGAWFSGFSTHYYERESEPSAAVLCHLVMPQYNAHGMYVVGKDRVEPQTPTPSNCVNDSYAVHYYFYHGSIGYFALFSEGKGTYCSLDHTTYTATTAIGSNDINFSALAKFEGGTEAYISYFYGTVGSVWLAYRVLVLIRSFASCSRYGRRLNALGQHISVSSAIVYVQQAARLAPHSAKTWHRLVLMYLLVEGLMTDLFLLIAYDGVGAKLQYISLGYNISGLLSMVFEIMESRKQLKPSHELLAKRLFFNTELTIWGELIFSALMEYYFTAINRSKLGPSRHIAEAVSYYMWSLVNHAIIVGGQAAFILTVRLIGTLAYVQYRFGSLKSLDMPCCADSVMGYRCKLMTISGYVIRDSQLCYLKETLQAHGLLQMTETDGKEFLVYHKIYWLPANRDDLAIVGRLTGEHVEPCLESIYTGPVAVCDRMLGGMTDAEDWEFHSDDVSDLESARLVGCTSKHRREILSAD